MYQQMEVELGIKNNEVNQNGSGLREGPKAPQSASTSMGDATLTCGRIEQIDRQAGNRLGMIEMVELEPDRRSCLVSLDPNVQPTMVKESQSVSHKRGGKWVRLQRDKVESGELKKLETHDNKVMTPNKRVLSCITEAEGLDTGGLEKRVKLQDGKENMDTELVGGSQP